MTIPEISSTQLETRFGKFEFFCFTWGTHEEDNVLVELKRPFVEHPLVRIQSACYTAEIFRTLDCDYHEQLETSLERIASEGGALIYMLADGRGAGLQIKVRGLELGRTMGLIRQMRTLTLVSRQIRVRMNVQPMFSGIWV
jgi:GTP cyclohydrolase II